MGEEPLGLPSPDKLKFAVPELLLRQAILKYYLTLPFGKVNAQYSKSTGPRLSRNYSNSAVAKCHNGIGLSDASGITHYGAKRQ